MLTQSQIDSFHENGFLRLEQVYSPEEMEALSRELTQVMETFANWEAAWRGPWRKEYMDEAVNEKALMVSIHELQHYSAAWMRAITKPELAADIAALLGSEAVEIHHNTLHAKGPEAGAPFPMHQDVPFYPHEDGRYIDALVHIDNADEESGCIKFLAGSHKAGKLAHITGPVTEPHLPTDRYRLEDAVSVPAKSGDVVVFHLYTVHGSSVNRSGRWRRLVRVGFRDPLNRQEGGQALGRPGLIVHGVRPKVEGIEVDVYGNWKNNR
jgi:ectoine hydroxylase-related dioxygenase (phytanoyl-CoA dioxygenase family)